MRTSFEFQTPSLDPTGAAVAAVAIRPLLEPGEIEKIKAWAAEILTPGAGDPPAARVPGYRVTVGPDGIGVATTSSRSTLAGRTEYGLRTWVEDAANQVRLMRDEPTVAY